jgi:hypothetical protein
MRGWHCRTPACPASIAAPRDAAKADDNYRAGRAANANPRAAKHLTRKTCSSSAALHSGAGMTPALSWRMNVHSVFALLLVLASLSLTAANRLTNRDAAVMVPSSVAKSAGEASRVDGYWSAWTEAATH